jgi:hypothetical protein
LCLAVCRFVPHFFDAYSQSQTQLSWLKLLWFSSGCPSKCLDPNSSWTVTAPFQILFHFFTL